MHQQEYLMKKQRFAWILVFLVFSVFSSSTNIMAATKEASSIIGGETWNFNLTSTQDRLVNYGDDYYGKTFLIITFFPAAFTPVWTGEMQGHQKNLPVYASLNAQVVGVSRDDVVTLKYWAKKYKLAFPLLSNISGYLGDYYGVTGNEKFVFNRRTVIVDKKAVIRYAKDGSPNYEEIIAALKKLNQEDGGK
jgi:peroxiredoxin